MKWTCNVCSVINADLAARCHNCKMTGHHLEERFVALQSEVARLKENAVERDKTNTMVTSALMQSEAENARLRDLLKHTEITLGKTCEQWAETEKERDQLREVLRAECMHKERIGLQISDAAKEILEQRPVPSQLGEKE